MVELEESNAVPKDVIRGVFHNLEEVLAFQTSFYNAMIEEYQNRLPDLFAEKASSPDTFSCYYEFCINYSKAIQVMLKHKQQFSVIYRPLLSIFCIYVCCLRKFEMLICLFI